MSYDDLTVPWGLLETEWSPQWHVRRLFNFWPMLAQGHRYFVSFLHHVHCKDRHTLWHLLWWDVLKVSLGWIESQRNIYLRIKLTWKICLFPYFEKIAIFKYEGHLPFHLFFYYRPQRSWGKVIFSEACVKNSVGGGVSAPLHAGRHPPAQCMLGYTGNKWVVRILLECILV